MEAADTLAKDVGVRPACGGLAIAHASYYRWKSEDSKPEKKYRLICTPEFRQYCCSDYINLLKEHNIKISMSKKGAPLENAIAESFMGSLKIEEVYMFRI